jgi:hypothetical protein
MDYMHHRNSRQHKLPDSIAVAENRIAGGVGEVTGKIPSPRPDFIGWTHAQRQKNLHLIVNNARFLILPWVCSENLASKILGLAARQLPQDWQHRYGFRPLLLETFVEKDRFTGTCYREANWIHVGKTQGRGKLGPSGKQSVPIKDVWLYPLGKTFKYGMVR